MKERKLLLEELKNLCQNVSIEKNSSFVLKFYQLLLV